MKPRVFISSTYYDLKYVRENLVKFIEEKYEFEAVLFERGNIPYSYEKSVGESCYMEVERCNVMILIVGGKYGSIDSSDEELDLHISFTQNEFRAAVKKKIPIFIFVDRSVLLEYRIFKKNKKMGQYTPVFVDDTKIFNFIDEFRELQIQPFEKIEEIENYLIEQWTGWFYLYLEDLKNKLYDTLNTKLGSTLDTVEKLKNILDEMAEKILDEQQLKKIQEHEMEIDLKNYAEVVSESIFFKDNVPRIEKLEEFCQKFVQHFCNKQVVESFNDTSINRFDYFEKLIQKFNAENGETIKIKTIDFDKLLRNNQKVIELINEETNKNLFVSCLTDEIRIYGE